MADAPLNVLFLCTGNTARSILAEGLLWSLGQGRFCSYSAGSQPKGIVNPLALKVLRKNGHAADSLRSKSWEEFAGPNAPAMHVIITVCDNAAGETCPLWPGRPQSAHWGIPDPAGVAGSESDKELAFDIAYGQLRRRIEAFLAIPLATLASPPGREAMARIGQINDLSVPSS